jgi:hypothetical protein
MTTEQVEAGIFLLAQTGLLIWTISGMRADLKNLSGWVAKVAGTSERTALRLAKIEGRLHIEPEPEER